MGERKDVTIFAPVAKAQISISGLADAILVDPDRPTVGPNELAAELGWKIDPRTMNHNCSECGKTMSWELFVAHLQDTKEGPGCFRRNFKLQDIKYRKFSGASLGDANGNA